MIERCLGPQRSRKFRRALRRCRVTIPSFLLTVVVLRGIIGAGKFGTPVQDFVEIRDHILLNSRKRGELHRVLEEHRQTTSSSISFSSNAATNDNNNYNDFNKPDTNKHY
ncbi:hypothetical protein Ddye_016928 [Dipteronia dyeriana]|uniref:Uncharacterized protein n=1 Tax=Dipteronia dyeriana TaxID=168575 RepID=A0AAD9WZB0_9ROSI|nr:hypothetical protein Ddye_016928 [Dipteronia dyeriana]